MNNTHEINDFEGKSQKLTLEGYYKGLPRRRSPRYDFISEVVKRCNVREQTVRNWILYGIRPQQKQHIEVLSELTGIKAEDLWTD